MLQLNWQTLPVSTPDLSYISLLFFLSKISNSLSVTHIEPHVSGLLYMIWKSWGQHCLLIQTVLWCLFPAEDPSENYVKVRDYVLVKLCQGLPSFATDKLHLGFSADMAKEAQDKLKINKVMHEATTNCVFVTYYLYISL